MKKRILMTSKKSKHTLCFLTVGLVAYSEWLQAAPAKQVATSPATLLYSFKQSNRACSIAFSPDGKLCATVGDDGVVRLWETRKWKLRRVFRGTNSIAAQRDDEGLISLKIAFSPDGTTLVAVGYILESWNVKTGSHYTFHDNSSIENNKFQHTLLFSPSGELFTASGGYDGTESRLTLWNLRTRRTHWSKASPGGKGNMLGYQVTGIAYSPDNRIIVSAGTKVCVWDTKTGFAKVIERNNDANLVSLDLDFSRKGKVLAIAFKSISEVNKGQIRLYDSLARNLLRTIYTNGVEPNEIEFSTTGRFLAAVNTDFTKVDTGNPPSDVRIWDSSTGKLLQRLRNQSSFAFSPNGKLLISGSRDNIVNVWAIK